VKPLHLNLASRPYRDYRPVYAVIVAASLLIAYLTLVNFDTYYRYRHETRTTRAKIEQLDVQTETERRRADQADAQLKTVNMTALDKQTRFINAQLAERAFSWSELLDKLEKVLPQNVRITTISPTFDETTGLVHLEIACEDKVGGGMIEMINRMMTASQFTRPFPHVETRTGADPKSGSYQFSLSVDFKPAVARVVSK
jgi:Tfp pilus assembly protein PilN